ncbi:putative ribonuclease H-like domain-containing protein [Tanacetum coccineum]|uniref:Ribonuclease H-like domain-containing protein n=1 Tax=Tanacetum coccineum TaxID=301880 RepID=A0ABQ4ZAS4_9ASTR
MTHPHPNRRFVPQTVLTKFGKINTAGASVNTAIRPVNTAGSKPNVTHPRPISNAYKKGFSQVTRPFNKYSEYKNNIFNKRVNTVRVKDTTARDRAVQKEYKEQEVIDSGCSRHMTGNKCYIIEYEDYDGGFVSFGDGKGRISGKSVSQICDKKNNVLFTDTECLVLSFDFKLLDESQVLLRVPRKDNIYSVDLKSVVPTKGLTCLFAKATIDESNLWHRRLGHINFKNINKLVKGNLVRGLPSKIFENNHSCVACQKGKQHKASFVTDDFSRFSWVFFLATKDETSGILKTFITEIENQLDHKVKVIRCDNGTEFKNSVMNQLCEMKEIKREFNVARTPRHNGVAERRNRTLIEAARTMLVDSKLPTTFWAEAVNTACYVLNRVLVIKPHNKIPYELICGRTPLIDFMKPFGCPVTILNTRDHLGKFDGKANEGFFVGYSEVSKAMRVFNKRTRIVEETLNIRFLENTPNVIGNGPDWIFDVDSLIISMNYVPVIAGNQTNGIAGTRDNIITCQAEKRIEHEQEYILIPICTTDPLISQDPKVSEEDAEEKPTEMDENGDSDKDGKDDQATKSEFERLLQQEKQSVHPNNTNNINTVSTHVSAAGPSFTNDDPSSPVNAAEASNAFEEHLFERFSPFKNAFTVPPISNVTPMDDTGIFGNAYNDEDVSADADLNNLETTMNVSPIPTTRIDKDHPKDQIIRDFNLAIQTRRMTKISGEHAMVCYINKQRRTNHKDYQNCLFACFLSQTEPKKLIQALEDPNWIEAMQEELLQFQLQKVFRNKKDERGIVVRNKVRLVAQGYTQEEGIDYDEVFAPVAMIEAIRLFLAYASFMGFIVYQMDVKRAFLYGTIEEEVYVCQPPSFEDPQFPNKVYKVEKALYGLHQAPRAWYETLSTYLIENGFKRGTIDKTLFIKKDKGDILLVQVYVDDIIFGSTKKSLCDEFKVQHKKDGIFISQDKYVADILKKFDFATVKTASNPMEPNKALIKDEEADNSDYAGASLDRKSTTGGYQFLGKRLISWQCKKQTIVANSTIEAEYVAAANCYGQVLWIQNQMLDYGFNFMNTKIYIDNESTICIVKNLVFHSKTKHIEIRHHFIRDCYKKKLIQVIKIHTDHNVADLLTKAFDVSRSERVLEKPNELPIPKGHTSRSGEGSMEYTFELMDIVPPTPHDSPLTGGYTPESDEGRLKLKELMAICTKLSKQVLDLEKEKDAQAVEILKLKQRVKKLERKRKSSISHPRRRIYRQVKSFDDDLDQEDASKQGRESDKTKSMFQDSDFDVLDDDMEDVEGETVSITNTTGVNGHEDLTIAQTLIKMKEEKAKEKRVVIKDVKDSPRPIRSITILQPLLTIDPKDKSKGVLVEEEPEKPKKVKRRDQGLAQMESDAELAQRLHEEELAELDRAQKERQKQEEATSAALAEEFDEIQARIDADHELAIRLTHEEQKKEKKWIDDFKPIDDDSQQQAESTKKRPRADFEEESSKKQKLEDDNDAEKEELRDSMDVVPRHDIAIDVESLATKYPIVDWKTYILNKIMMYYQIIRADGSSKNYKIFSEMLDDFDRQDVIDLHRVAIHMMIEKKYPLTQEMLSRMLNRRLEVDYESEMAFELLRFTRSQLQK